MNRTSKKKKPNRLNPGEVVLAQMGLGPIVAGLKPEFPSLSRSTVWRWAQHRSAGGTGGIIPARYHRPLLQLAERTGCVLTADDLVNGRAG